MSNFPWPVITDSPDTSDYPGSIINLQEGMVIEAVTEGLRFKWKPASGSEFLDQLLASGVVHWVVEFNCPKTLFVKRFALTKDAALNESLSFNEVRGDVHVSAYLRCVVGIESFRPRGVSPELAALEFCIKAGDIIGVGKRKVLADPEFLMAPGMRSIFRIRPAGPIDGNSFYRCSNDGDYFTLVLSKALYDQLYRARAAGGAAGRKAASALIILAPLALLVKELGALGPNSPELTTAQRRLLTLIESSGIPELEASTHPLEVALQLLEKSDVLSTCFEKIART